RREFQDLDRVEILHAPADALRRVEEDVRLRRIGIAQHAHALAVDDEIAAAEIAEGDGMAARVETGHVLALDDRIAKKARGLARRHGGPPEIIPLAVLELPDRTEDGSIHDESAGRAIGLFRRIDEI